MTSRPAAPESETPETDAVDIELLRFKSGEHYGLEVVSAINHGYLVEHARSLERRLSLAQTEIKGHVRIEEDLKVRIAELEETRAVLKSQMDDWLAENHKTLAARDNAAARADQAQSRIAELEKELAELHREWAADILAATDLRQDAARYRWLRSNKRLLNITIEQFHPVRKTLCDEFADAAIDAALKSRA